jgi:hypothetical protein
MLSLRVSGHIIRAGALVALLPTPVSAHPFSSAVGDAGWPNGALLASGLLLLAVVGWMGVDRRQEVQPSRPWRDRSQGLTGHGRVARRLRRRLVRLFWLRDPRVRRVARNPTLSAVFTVWLLISVGATTPHLVHHLFDASGGADCAFMQVAHHTPGGITGPVVVPAPVPVSDTPPPSRALPLALRSVEPSPSRGPPAVLPASTSV